MRRTGRDSRLQFVHTCSLSLGHLSSSPFLLSLSGSCRFGDRCRFSHGAGHTPAPRAPRAPRGESGAPRDNTCYAFAQNGSCKFGDACRFSHGGAAPGAAAASSSAFSSRPRRSRPLASKSQLCFSFSESQQCQYGDQCRFAHGDNDERDLNQLKRRAAGVCYNWKESGECKFGEGCRFAHENIPEGARGADAKVEA